MSAKKEKKWEREEEEGEKGSFDVGCTINYIEGM